MASLAGIGRLGTGMTSDIDPRILLLIPKLSFRKTLEAFGTFGKGKVVQKLSQCMHSLFLEVLGAAVSPSKGRVMGVSMV